MTVPPAMTPLELAGRAWDAAHALDELRGDRTASAWTVEKIRGLIREGRAGDVEALAGIAGALERRLERDTGRAFWVGMRAAAEGGDPAEVDERVRRAVDAELEWGEGPA